MALSRIDDVLGTDELHLDCARDVAEQMGLKRHLVEMFDGKLHYKKRRIGSGYKDALDNRACVLMHIVRADEPAERQRRLDQFLNDRHFHNAAIFVSKMRWVQ